MSNKISSHIEACLKTRKQWIESILAEKQVCREPDEKDKLRICGNGDKVMYYKRSGRDTNGVYIKKKDREQAVLLAQRDYDERVLRAAKDEQSGIRKVLEVLPQKSVEDVYASMSRERQALITPVWIPDDEYVCQWESYVYERKGFRDDMPEFYTEKNERVRSKSEILIANTLKKMGIPYRYECPLKLERFGLIHPDFTVLHVRLRKTLYLEHLGSLDELGYANNAVERINGYIRNGIFPGDQLFMTFETSKQPLNTRILEVLFERYFK